MPLQGWEGARPTMALLLSRTLRGLYRIYSMCVSTLPSSLLTSSWATCLSLAIRSYVDIRLSSSWPTSGFSAASLAITHFYRQLSPILAKSFNPHHSALLKEPQPLHPPSTWTTSVHVHSVQIPNPRPSASSQVPQSNATVVYCSVKAPANTMWRNKLLSKYISGK